MLDPRWKEIGSQIRQIRLARGFSQKRLAERSGISRPSISNIENGTRAITFLELTVLARILQFGVNQRTWTINPIKAQRTSQVVEKVSSGSNR